MTRLDPRSVEQVIGLDNTDDVYNWPFLYAVEVEHWSLNDEEAKQLRDFLNRGGFLMVAICANMDLGDAVERSDEPSYPEKFATLAYRILVNYTVYDLTH